MKRSSFKLKLPDPQKQLKEAYKEAKRQARLLGLKGRSRTGAIGSYYEGEWIPSKWELECKKYLRFLEKAGKIKDLSKETITYTVYNENGESRTEKIEIDFCFFHNELNRPCRWDAKPPKVAHTRQGRRYPQKVHELWKFKFEQLKFCQPDYDYRILEKGRIWRDIDI